MVGVDLLDDVKGALAAGYVETLVLSVVKEVIRVAGDGN
jgi:hypothetical protein